MSGVIKQKGVDISKWQRNPDWRRLNSAGLDFIIFRSSYRKNIDPKFLDYVKKCKIPIVGIYHFIYATNEEEASNEAKVCIEAANKAILSKETIIFADYEYDSIKDAAKKGINITPKDCQKITEAFLNTINDNGGFDTGIYCNKDFYNNWYTKSFIQLHKLWLADYHDANPSYPCDFHQYSSRGRVKGISGNVDMNYRYINQKEIKTIDEIALEVIEGKWGNGAIRKTKLTSAGYNYNKVQQRVNSYLRGR